MHKIGRYVLIIVCFFLIQNSVAQFYSTGQDPARVKWQQINTDNFQIIFPKDFSSKAQHFANVLTFYYQKVGNSLNHKPQKISVILHNQLVVGNGYVSWAPKRIELYTTPNPDTYPDPWLEHLCVHELRHVVQIDKLNQGFTKILSIVFGQQATGLVAGQLPPWFLEGDAVCTETAFGNFGRGRMPEFNRLFKAHLLSNQKQYSFDKMVLGSYKDFVPNHYELGYQLTAYARKKYGKDVWNKVENHVARNSFSLLPSTWAFYRGLKKNYGISQKDLYKETTKYLDSIWSVNNAKRTQSPHFQNVTIDAFENYLTPWFVSENYVLALKKGKSHSLTYIITIECSSLS